MRQRDRGGTPQALGGCEPNPIPMHRHLRPRSSTLGALLVLLALLSTLPASARVVRIYEVRNRVAQELAPLVETALGAEGSVVADARTNTLVITGEPAAVESALALLASLDARLRTVLLRYVSEDAGSLQSRGARVRWQISAGGLRVGNLVGPATDGAPASLAVDESRRQDRGTRTAELRVLEGESGRIASGVTAPLREQQVLRTPRGPVYRETTRLVSADSGIEVRPRILGDGRIDLSLRPFDERLGRDGSVERAGAETRLVLSPGQTIVLGRIADAERSRERELATGSRSESGTRERLLLVTVWVE
jgi:type II secretory pathway component HofQ